MIQRAPGCGGRGARDDPATGGRPDDRHRHRELVEAGRGDEAVSSEYTFHRGVYAAGDRLLAINRPSAEDLSPVLSDDQVAGLFRGLDFARVDDREGNVDSLIQEVWRLFLIAMITALLVEAALCMPRPARVAAGATT